MSLTNLPPWVVSAIFLPLNNAGRKLWVALTPLLVWRRCCGEQSLWERSHLWRDAADSQHRYLLGCTCFKQLDFRSLEELQGECGKPRRCPTIDSFLFFPWFLLEAKSSGSVAIYGEILLDLSITILSLALCLLTWLPLLWHYFQIKPFPQNFPVLCQLRSSCEETSKHELLLRTAQRCIVLRWRLGLAGASCMDQTAL